MGKSFEKEESIVSVEDYNLLVEAYYELLDMYNKLRGVDSPYY